MTPLTKKILAMMVTFTMAASMLPVSAFAYADNGEDGQSAESKNAASTTIEEIEASAAESSSAKLAAQKSVVATSSDTEDDQLDTPEGQSTEQAGTSIEDSGATSPESTSSDSEAASATAVVDSAPGSTTTSEDNASDNDPVASIGSTKYETLQAAIKDAKSGDTISLIKDIDLTGAGALNIAGITIDLKGHAISATNFSVEFEGSGATLKNGSFLGLKNASYALFIGDSAETNGFLCENLTLSGGINIFNASNVVLRNVDADASATDSLYYAVWCDVNAQAVIESGTYRSNGAAVLGLTDNSSGAPASIMEVKGGDFYTDSSPLVLGGENRYKPELAGGTFPSKEDVEPYVAPDCYVLLQGDGRVSVNAKDGVTQLDTSKTELPSSAELIVVEPTESENEQIEKFAEQPEIKNELDKAGGTSDLWVVDVILRNKETLVEDHDTEVSFTLSYPNGIDANNYTDYDFEVLHIVHLESTDDNGDSPEILPSKDVVPTADGLRITTTLSPLAISYGLKSSSENPSDDNGNSTAATKPATNKDTVNSGSSNRSSSNNSHRSNAGTSRETRSTNNTRQSAHAADSGDAKTGTELVSSSEASVPAGDAKASGSNNDAIKEHLQNAMNDETARAAEAATYSRSHIGGFAMPDNAIESSASDGQWIALIVLGSIAAALALSAIVILLVRRKRDQH